MKKILIPLMLLICFSANSQTIWNYQVLSCGDPYDYCLEAQHDFDLTEFPMLRFRDTSLCQIFTDTTYFSCLKSGCNPSKKISSVVSFVTVDALGKLLRCSVDSVFIPYTHITGAPAAGKRIDSYSGSTNSSGTYTVTFSSSFSAAPNVQVNIPNQSSTNQFIRVSSVNTTGCTIQVYARATLTVLGIDLLSAGTTNVNGASVDVLVVEK